MSGVMRITEADEHAQRDIENDIDRYLQAVIELRRRLNSFARINRLPLELLIEILCFCQDGPWTTKYQDGSKYGRTPPPLRWMLTLHVCHHWRDIALQTPRIWCRINVDYPTFTRECSIIRAKRYPLHLVVNQWNSAQIDLFNELALGMERIHSIDMCLAQSTFPSQSSFNKIPSATSPLTFLRVTTNYGSPHSLPMIFEKCQFPEIRRLELGGHIGKVPLALLGATLTQLRLSTGSHQAVEPIAFSRLLSQMSQLELLHLQGVSFCENANKSSATIFTQKLPLPALRRLIVQPALNAHRDYISLLENLDIPSPVQIHLKFPHMVLNDEDLSALCRATLVLLRPLIFHSLALYDSYETLIIGLWKDTVEPGILNSELDVPYGLWLPQSMQSRTILWEELLHALDLHLVENLQFGNLLASNSVLENCKRLLCTFQCLQHVCLKGHSVSAFVELLLENENEEPNSGANDVKPRLIVPQLKVLHFQDVIWRTLEEVQSEERGNLMDYLITGIRDREGGNCPLEKVVITRCVNMDDHDVECLQDLGATVVWDGDVYYEDGESESVIDIDAYDGYNAFLDDDFEYFDVHW